mmetsp:Transcript_82573/g.161939  ORF Transcript_82573/g.161939 Transcript_82573/m.161939 type:complete len:240 (-) Transcript_82573:281-1000(-)
MFLHREHNLAKHVRGVNGRLRICPERSHELVHDGLDVLLESVHVHRCGDWRLVEPLQVLDDLIRVSRTQCMQELPKRREGLPVQGGCDAGVEDRDVLVLLGVQDVAAMQIAVDEVVPNHHLHAHVIQCVAKLRLQCAPFIVQCAQGLLASCSGVVEVVQNVRDDLAVRPCLHQNLRSDIVGRNLGESDAPLATEVAAKLLQVEGLAGEVHLRLDDLVELPPVEGQCHVEELLGELDDFP